jgi:RNA polymerase sigma-70 factor (ECF subfamily)
VKTKSSPDEVLVALAKRARRGDGEAFAELFNAVHQAVLNYVYRIVGDRQAAEDVTQDAFIRAHERISRLGPPWDFKSWVFRIAGNMALDQLRANKRFVDIEEPGEMSGPPTTRRPAEKRVQRREARQDVEATLALLPVNFRQALVLREMSGLSYQEVAQVMDVSYDNARQLVHRGRLQFREAHGLRMMANSGAARCQVLDELLSAYLDGELSAERRRVIREHIDTCEHCQETERDLQKVAGLLAGVAPIVPSAGWVQGVLNQIGISKGGSAAASAGAAPGPGGGGVGGGTALSGWGAKLLAGGAAAVLGLGILLTAGAYALGFFESGQGLAPQEAVQATVEAVMAGTPPTLPAASATPGGDDAPALPPAPVQAASPTPTPTPTEELGPPFVIARMNANCRFGPGAVYDVVGYLLEGQRAAVAGRDAGSTWWWIDRVDGFGRCWIWDDLVEREGDFRQVPVVPAPPTPTPPDGTAPQVSISHSPQGSGHPLSNELVTFSASASDPGGIAWIEIYLQAPGESTASLVKRCENAASCSYRGGPYPAGPGSYYARAADRAGNLAQSGVMNFNVNWYLG